MNVDEVDRSSGDYAPVVGLTKAVVHTPPSPSPSLVVKSSDDPLAPNDSLAVHVTKPSEMPPLRICAPNESSLFKLASSAPTSPHMVDQEVALCQQFLEQEAAKQRAQLQLASEDAERLEQLAVQELPCDRIDVAKTPKLPSTGCQIISQQKLQSCDGVSQQQQNGAGVNEELLVPKEEDVALCIGLLDCLAPAQEPSCESIDVRVQPVPATGFKEISDAEVSRCDGLHGEGAKDVKSCKPSTTLHNSGSPIGDARAAHSKALMETCEQIIAEERLASSQMMRSSLPEGSGSTPGTPLATRKSKIPIPKPCCISASNTDSITRTGYLPTGSTATEDGAGTGAVAGNKSGVEPQPLIARTHVVETELNVKPRSPPTSPKPEKVKEKKTKNIFDFLRRNFGHGHDESSAPHPHPHPQPHPTLNETLEPKVVLTSTRSGVDVVDADPFVKVDNSKFYVAGEEPPPLPATPAPVNIEIRKTITTDEILEEHNTEQALSQEISDLLDDELNKLSLVGDGAGAGH